MPKRTQKEDLQRKALLLYLVAATGVLLSWGMASRPEIQNALPEKKIKTLPDRCQQFVLEDEAVLELCNIIQVSGIPFNHEARNCYRAIQALNKTDHISVHVSEKIHHDIHLHNSKRLRYHLLEKEGVAALYFYEHNLKNYETLLEIHQCYLNRTNDTEFLSALKNKSDTVSRFLCREFEKVNDFEKIFASHFKQYEQLNKLPTNDFYTAHQEVRRVLTEKKDTTICRLERAIERQEKKAQKQNHRFIFHTGSTLFQGRKKCTGNRREPVSDRFCKLNFQK